LPSPIAHAAAGYAIYKLYANRNPDLKLPKINPFPILLVITITLSFLPDFDFFVGFLLGDFDRFHNSFSNSLLVGLFVALLIGLVVRIRYPAKYKFWLLLVLLAYELHVIMDYLGIGRGVMLFWPVSSERYLSPVKLFYGLHRSEGLISIRHLWTFLTEMVFAIGVFVAVNLLTQKSVSARSRR
jgi:inner membrane protein